MEFDFTAYKNIQINGKDVVKVEDISGNVLWTAGDDGTVTIWSFDRQAFWNGEEIEKKIIMEDIGTHVSSGWIYKDCLGEYTWDETNSSYVNDVTSGYTMKLDGDSLLWKLYDNGGEFAYVGTKPIGNVTWHISNDTKTLYGRYEREYSLDFLDDMPKTLTMSGSVWPDIGLEGSYTLLDSPESIHLVNQKDFSMLTDYICSGQTLVYVNDSNPNIYMLYAPDDWYGAHTQVASAWVLVSSNFTLTSYYEDIYDEDGSIKKLPITSSYFYRYAAGPETTDGTWTGLNTYIGYSMTGHFS